MKDAEKKEFLVFIDPDLESIVPRFLERQQEHIRALQEAYSSKNYTGLKQLGHKMKGSCGGYGFDELGKLAGLMEKAAEEKDLESLAKHIGLMETYLANVRIQYKKGPESA